MTFCACGTGLDSTWCWSTMPITCLLYTSDAADDMQCVDLGGRRIIKKKKTQKNRGRGRARRRCCCFFFFKQKTAYEIGVRLVGSEMCIRDSTSVCWPKNCSNFVFCHFNLQYEFFFSYYILLSEKNKNSLKQVRISEEKVLILKFYSLNVIINLKN